MSHPLFQTPTAKDCLLEVAGVLRTIYIFISYQIPQKAEGS